LNGEPALQVLGRLRNDIAAKQQELKAVEQAPLCKSELKAAVRRQLASRATCPPMIDPRTGAYRFEFNWRDPEAIAMALLGPAGVLTRLESRIDAMPDDHALPAKARQERIASLQAEILDCEFREEALVESLLAQGQSVERRVAADVRAVLGVVVTKAKTNAA
jgi:hypothetical protein